MTMPNRAYTLTLKVGADTRHDLALILEHLAIEVSADRLTEGVSGGYSTGFTYKLEVDESMTHDRYFEELNRYLDAQKVIA